MGEEYSKVRQRVYEDLVDHHRALGLEEEQAKIMAELTVQREERLLGLRDRLVEFFGAYQYRNCSALEVNPW